MDFPACFVFIDAEKATGHIVRVEGPGLGRPVVALARARALAWPLNRFEADDFAAAFVAANRSEPGAIRLVGYGLWGQIAPRDTRRIFVVQQFPAQHVGVRAYAVEWDQEMASWTYAHLWDAPLKTIEQVIS